MAEIHTVMESVMRVQSFIFVQSRSGGEGKDLELVMETGDSRGITGRIWL
jgi:hypothetical protein